jgi:hypothetical protein
VPPVRHVVPWRVAEVAVLPNQRLRIRFVDGTSGEVDLRPLLESDQVTGTVFEPLRDPRFFAQARVVLGAVQWPNGADLAPDAMYDAIDAHGRWVVD